LDRAVERERARIRGLEREIADAGKADELRETASLILTRLKEIPKGSSSVVLEGFGGGPVEVGMDPSLSPRENADALYEEAARQERAWARIPELLQSARTKLGELEVLREGLEEGSIPPEDAEPKIPEAPRAQRKPIASEIRLPYLRFRSSGGLEIRVGRGAKDNDELTFRHSRPADVWLHARDASGAHVVLRWQGDGSPPPRDLAEAAVLAVLNSRHRTSAAAPVDWTRRKHVRKPRGAPPGTVVPQRVRTLFVTVDPALPERLKWEV
jgi:predicted ribosome quality control (RQC) complex YloA/Tae2 family protein